VATPTPHKGTGKEKRKKEEEEKTKGDRKLHREAGNHTTGHERRGRKPRVQPEPKCRRPTRASRGRNPSVAGRPERLCLPPHAGNPRTPLFPTLRTTKTSHPPFLTLRVVRPNVAGSERWQSRREKNPLKKKTKKKEKKEKK
jgi:hypothetical protein